MAAATDQVETPFLQLVMERLWRAAVDAGRRALTLATLVELGGAQRIVETHLVDALGALAPREREIAADAFRYLVTQLSPPRRAGGVRPIGVAVDSRGGARSRAREARLG